MCFRSPFWTQKIVSTIKDTDLFAQDYRINRNHTKTFIKLLVFPVVAFVFETLNLNATYREKKIENFKLPFLLHGDVDSMQLLTQNK